MRSGAGIVFIPVAIVIGLIYLVIYHFVRRRQLTRMRDQALGDFVFTFTSTGWYQAAIIELRERGIIPAEMRTDSEDPFQKGPRWIAASSSGLRVMRGFDSEPRFTISWTDVASVTRETRVRTQGRDGPYTVANVAVRTATGTVSLMLANANASGRVVNTRGSVDDVVAELERLRAGEPAPPPDKPVIL